jgi:hypothetical protein
MELILLSSMGTAAVLVGELLRIVRQKWLHKRRAAIATPLSLVSRWSFGER